MWQAPNSPTMHTLKWLIDLTNTITNAIIDRKFRGATRVNGLEELSSYMRQGLRSEEADRR